MAQQSVVYFHGCGTNYYEPGVGEMVVEVLDVLSQKRVEEDSRVEAAVRDKVKALLGRFPIYQD